MLAARLPEMQTEIVPDRTYFDPKKRKEIPDVSYRSRQCSGPMVFWDGGMNLFWLDDAQWRAIAPLLPSRQTGPQRADDRKIISGILHVLISGCAWRDCPIDYGPFMTVFNRFNRWKTRGIWTRVAHALAKAPGASLAPEQIEKLRVAVEERTRANSPQPRAHFAAQRLAANRAWEEASAQLRKIVQAHQGKPASTWINAVVEWHMDSLFAEIERTSGSGIQDDDALRLKADISDLRTKLLATLTALRIYADDPARNAPVVKRQLAKLQDELLQAAIGTRPAKIS